jgi:hypothetical protein
MIKEGTGNGQSMKEKSLYTKRFAKKRIGINNSPLGRLAKYKYKRVQIINITIIRKIMPCYGRNSKRDME